MHRKLRKEHAQALEASVYGGGCVDLLMDQVGSERSQVNGPNLRQQRCGALVHPREPRVESGKIVRIGPHGSRGQIAIDQMSTEDFEQVCIRVRGRC
jgi:hypothetical protein